MYSDRCSLTLDEGTGDPIVAHGPAAHVGRDPRAEVHLESAGVSRLHAALEYADGAWTIRDLDSTNGVFVNGTKISHAELDDGDRVRVSDVQMTFRAEPLDQTSWIEPQADEAEDFSSARTYLDIDGFIAGKLDEQAGQPQTSARALRLVRSLTQVTEALVGEGTLADKARRVLEVIMDSVDAAEGGIYTVNDAGEYEAQATRSAKTGTQDTLGISIHRAITSEAMRERRTILQDAEMGAGGAPAGSILCAPLCGQSNTFGFIYLSHPRPTGIFDDTHLLLMTTVAAMLTADIRQSRLRARLEVERKVRARLARYHSKAAVDQIVQTTTIGGAGMRVQEREVSVLFCDICGFTSRAESMRPVEIALLLNAVFEDLTQIVFAFEGMLDKFMGDGMMVVFGTPMEQPDHAARAVGAALQMRDRVVVMNRQMQLSPPLRMRFGVNSGTVVAGDIGSQHRKDLTVIGDAANVASRLESQVARPDDVVVGPYTRELAGEAFRYQPLEPLQLRGRQEKLQPYRVLDRA